VRGSPVPYWQFGGDAVVTEDFVRLTGTEKSRKGFLWNTMVSCSIIIKTLQIIQFSSLQRNLEYFKLMKIM
jgi:hypothetical protein